LFLIHDIFVIIILGYKSEVYFVKKLTRYFGLLTLVFLLILTFSVKTGAENVLITSIGQNPGGLMVKVVMDKMNKDFTYKPLIESSELKDYNTAILSLGCSQKGLCAADCSFKEELKRTKKIVNIMKKKNYPVILVHLGGKLKRDEKSNQLINVVAPISSHFVVTEESNNDKYFTEMSNEKDIELHIIKNLSKLENVFRDIFKN